MRGLRTVILAVVCALTPGCSSGTRSESISPAPAPCPSGLTQPSVGGRYDNPFCGPEPGRGNGDGFDGTCTGAETAPPCGPGVVAGRLYPYTFYGSCFDVIRFDGKQWRLDMTLSAPPSATVPTRFPVTAAPAPQYVYLRLEDDGRPRFYGDIGSVSFSPTDVAFTGCR